MNITKDTSIASLLESSSISVRAANVCRSNGIDRIGDLLKYTQADLANMRNCGRKTSIELVKLQSVVHDAGIWPHLDFNTDAPAVDLAVVPHRRIEGFDSLNRAVRSRIEIAYDALFAAMSVRSRNIFASLASFAAMRPYIEGRRHMRLSDYNGCGKRSSEEICSLLKHMAQILAAAVAEPANFVENEASSLEYYMTRVGEDFPFLTDDERRRVADLSAEGTDVSPFFLIARYICHLGTNHAEAYRMHYRIDGAPKAPSDMASIASHLGLTRERVRQLLMKRIPFPGPLAHAVSSIRCRLDDDFLRDDSPVFDRFLGSPMAPASRAALLGMITAIDDSYTIVSLSGSDTSYLVRKRLLSGVKVMATYYAVSKAVFRVTDSAAEFDIVDFIRAQSGPQPLAADVSRIAPLFTDRIGRTYGVTVSGTKIRVRANRFSIPAAIEDALARVGHALSLSELYDEVGRSHPQIKLPGIGAFKLYIYNSPAVAPVGKSGRYVLTTWDGVFTGTICQCVEMLLRRSAAPMSISEMMPEIRRYFPDTTLASVAGIVSMSVPVHFTPFGRGTFGLAGREYVGFTPARRRMSSKVTFEDRFALLRGFVAANGRFPMAADEEEASGAESDEGSLYRWLYNSTRRKVDISDENYALLDAFVRSNDRLPRTRRELAFARRCDGIRAAAAAGRPVAAADSHWLAAVTERRAALDPRRRRLLDALLADIEKR